MPWERAKMVGDPLPAGTVTTVANAFLSGFQVVRDDADGGRIRRMHGAVYAEGRLVRESQRSGGHRGDVVVAVDRSNVPLSMADEVPARRHLRGEWLYGGNWMGQFGHFVSELLPTLWPRNNGFSGLVFHRFISSAATQEWQRELLRLAGWDLPVKVIGEAHRVEKLAVPSRQLVINEAAGPEARQVWARIARQVRADGDDPVFLSRANLANDPRRAVGDDQLDARMRDIGFRVVHPETLSIGEQIAAVRRARILAAVSGSNLHLSAFASARTCVIEIGDARTPRTPVWNQRVIDAACGREAAFVPLLTLPGGARDVDATTAAVDDLVRTAPTTRAFRFAMADRLGRWL